MVWSLVFSVFLPKVCPSRPGRIRVGSNLLHLLALAQSAVHQPNVSALIPRSYFDEASYSNAISAVVSGVSSLLRNTAPKTFALDTPQTRDSEVSVFDILALVLRDESLAPGSTGVLESDTALSLVMKTKADVIRK